MECDWETTEAKLGTDLIHDWGGEGLNAWLLIWERQLLQQVHIGESILQSHRGRHGTDKEKKNVYYLLHQTNSMAVLMNEQ